MTTSDVPVSLKIDKQREKEISRILMRCRKSPSKLFKRNKFQKIREMIPKSTRSLQRECKNHKKKYFTKI